MNCLFSKNGLWQTLRNRKEKNILLDSGVRYSINVLFSCAIKDRVFIMCEKSFYYPPAIALRDIVIAAVRPSHFLVYAIT